MNSFQIQQLAGQIYSMNGMQTKMHLIANTEGVYRGRSVSFGGNGFANMRFKAHVVSQQAYDQWIKQAQHAPTLLTWKLYKTISGPTKDTSVHYYKLGGSRLIPRSHAQIHGPSKQTAVTSDFWCWVINYVIGNYHVRTFTFRKLNHLSDPLSCPHCYGRNGVYFSDCLRCLGHRQLL